MNEDRFDSCTYHKVGVLCTTLAIDSCLLRLHNIPGLFNFDLSAYFWVAGYSNVVPYKTPLKRKEIALNRILFNHLKHNQYEKDR